ncbi:MAG: hypothetical protein KDI36_04135 [Pseudomonadales bacterium]|nr:hypothetical protein [Pseudomonadales bacterium]
MHQRCDTIIQKRLTKLFAVATLFCASLVQAATIVVVGNFEDRTGFPEARLNQAAQEGVTNLLVSLPHLQIVERGRMDQILEEMNFSQSAFADGTNAAEFGRKLGAELVVFGSVSSASYSEGQRTGYNNQTEYFGKGTVSVNIQIIEVETNKTLFSESATGTTTGDRNRSTVLPEALLYAVNDISVAIQEKFPIKGYVIAVEENGRKFDVYLDIGKQVGIDKGRKITIFGEDKVFVHPVTKEEFRTATPLFTEKVNSAQDTTSVISLSKKQIASIAPGQRVEAQPEVKKTGSNGLALPVGDILQGLFKK